MFEPTDTHFYKVQPKDPMLFPPQSQLYKHYLLNNPFPLEIKYSNSHTQYHLLGGYLLRSSNQPVVFMLTPWYYGADCTVYGISSSTACPTLGERSPQAAGSAHGGDSCRTPHAVALVTKTDTKSSLHLLKNVLAILEHYKTFTVILIQFQENLLGQNVPHLGIVFLGEQGF